MRAAIFAYTENGVKTAKKIGEILPESEIFAPEKFAVGEVLPIKKPCTDFCGELFYERDALIFVSAAGIAVRSIAPYIKDKRTDPAVICIDERGKNVIPLLSGHIGGANALALKIAEHLGATPIITTATDVNGKFSVDKWASENGFVIDDMTAANAVSAAILNGDIPLASDLPVLGELPPGVKYGDDGDVGIYIGYRKKSPFATTLRLIPRCISLGLGCRRGTASETISKAVKTVFEAAGVDIRAVKRVSSIDLKRDEAGLLEFCESQNLPVSFYTAEELNSVPGNFAPSQFVEKITGTDNVCERSALMGAETLIIGKTAVNGVTVAAAEEKGEVRFV